MPDVFAYIDYREFLRDYYQEMKERSDAFSYQSLANRAGFRSKSYIKLVIDGKKNLTERSVEKLNVALKLKGKALSYFRDLVAFNQARSYRLRSYYFRRLCQYGRRNAAKTIEQKRHEFYSHWYHNTIRELVTQIDFDGDYERLAALLTPEIAAYEARQSVALLLSLGLMREEGGRYVQSDPIITTGDEVLSRAVAHFHRQNSRLIAGALERCPDDERDISCLILGLSDDGFAEVKHEIQRFRKKLLHIAARDVDQSRVYHVNFQLFPTTKNTRAER
jgi:uncharacterized protein (TIGR02147 family)